MYIKTKSSDSRTPSNFELAEYFCNFGLQQINIVRFAMYIWCVRTMFSNTFLYTRNHPAHNAFSRILGLEDCQDIIPNPVNFPKLSQHQLVLVHIDSCSLTDTSVVRFCWFEIDYLSKIESISLNRRVFSYDMKGQGKRSIYTLNSTGILKLSRLGLFQLSLT